MAKKEESKKKKKSEEEKKTKTKKVEKKEKPKKATKTKKKKEPKKAKKEKKVVKKAKPRAKKEPKDKEAKRYWEAVGRRKTSTARVRLWAKGEKDFLVNGRRYQEYFPTFQLQKTANASLEKMKALDRFRVSVQVRGGGLHSQAEAIRHGVARALVKFNPSFQKRLKKAGFLTRDSRMRERKKFGLRRARRAPQWQKR